MPSGTPSAWPLAGRGDAVAALAAALDAGGAYIVGDAGVGRTRFVREVVPRHAAGEVVWVDGATSTSALPLEAFGHAMPDGLDELDDVRSRFRALNAYLTSRRSPGGPATVVVDDAHLLSEVDAALCLRLARAGVTVVVTVVAGVHVHDALTTLWKDGMVARLDLDALDAGAVGLLLSEALGAPVEQATAARFHRVTGGSPLYLRELVVAARASGALAHSDGLWRAIDPVPVPRPLVDLVRSRIATLEPVVRTVLELVAVADPLPFGAIGDEHDEAVRVLEARGLVRIEQDGRRRMLRVTSPVLADGIRRSLGAIGRHAALSELLPLHAGAGARRAGDEVRRAVWELDAGAGIDVDALVAAGEGALCLADLPLAERLASAARSSGVGSPASILLARVFLEQGRYVEVDELLRGLAYEELNDDELASYAATRSYAVGLGLGRLDAALDLVLELASTAAPSARRQLDALRTVLLTAARRWDEAEDLARRLCAGDDDLAVRVRATVALARACNASGRFDESAARCADVLTSAQVPFALRRERAWLLEASVAASCAAGDHDEAAAVLRAVHDTALADDDDLWLGCASRLLGAVALRAGRVDVARRWLLEAMGPLTRTDLDGSRAVAMAELARSEAIAGDPAAARRAAAAAVASVHGDLRQHELDLCRAEIWSLAAEGQVTVAHELAVSAAGDHDLSPVDQALLLHDASRLGEPDPRTLHRLRELIRRFDGRQFRAIGAVTDAALAADPDALQVAAVSLAAHGSVLAAADAVAAASLLFTDLGRGGEAAAAQQEAVHLVAESGGAEPPAVRRLTPTPLTRREEQIIALAAGGASDREIASHLHLSVRTVENHLYRSYAKLGVAGRTSLSDTRSPRPSTS